MLNKGRLLKLFAMLIVVALAGLTGAMVAFATVTINTRSVTTINGEVFTLTGDLAVSGFSTSISTEPQTYTTGTTSESAVAMTTPVNTAYCSTLTPGSIPIGEYVYSATVQVVNIHDGVTYTVDLLQSGTSMGIVYIAQASSGAATGDSVTITWDLGTSLSSAVYEVTISPTS